MKKKFALILSTFCLSLGAMAQGYVDDLYYLSSDKKENIEEPSVKKQKTEVTNVYVAPGSTVEVRERVRKPKNNRSVDDYKDRKSVV